MWAWLLYDGAVVATQNSSAVYTYNYKTYLTIKAFVWFYLEQRVFNFLSNHSYVKLNKWKEDIQGNPFNFSLMENQLPQIPSSFNLPQFVCIALIEIIYASIACQSNPKIISIAKMAILKALG